MKKVLITGASGFIGRNCLPALKKMGYEIHAAGPDILGEYKNTVTWHAADLLDAAQTEKLLSGMKATHLLHFAWYAQPKKYWTSDENFKWLEASKRLVEVFYANGGRRAVAAGTCAEYDWSRGVCSEGSTPLLPATVYGKCKHAFQEALAEFSKENSLSSAWGRIFFLYGPHEHPGRLISSVILSLLQGKPASCSHGNQVRDFMYVKDVGSAFAALLESDVRGPVNIASGRPMALKDIISRIGEKIGAPELIRLGQIQAPKDEPQLLTADVTRLNKEVGWTPQYDIDSGLDETIEWWKENLAVSAGR
ncbi:MAG: NAD(P)-dependent oxidoreductase [Candidatus Omnitrophica bacterium]|nr:NAD(P)-dependent oxidoreductase [Candidatus Omnitrophota bacterium]